MIKRLVCWGCFLFLSANFVSAEKIAIIETDKGVIRFKFFQKEAPNTVANFVQLTNQGFYNGLTFHRVEPGFVIQGGDPLGQGTGGPGYTIKAEFNSRPHLEGTVAMARANDPDSAGSQFYICLAPQPFLDGKYTVFGQVISGMDVVKQIARGDKMRKVYIREEKSAGEPKTKEVAKLIANIHWLGHDGFRIEEGGKTIYTDPFNLKGKLPPADIILITHEHYDHCSPEDVRKIQNKNTVIVTIPLAAGKLSGNIKLVKPGDTVEIEGIKIEAVPAYNINKPFHPRSGNRVGFIITAGGKRIYQAGDTDLIPEMDQIKCDVALLPVSGTYVMTAEESAAAAAKIKPVVAIPMHWGAIDVGTLQDAERFRKLCQEKKPPVTVEILKKE